MTEYVTKDSVKWLLRNLIEDMIPVCLQDAVVTAILDKLPPADPVIQEHDYEAEINGLKDEINRLREMYHLEHMKVLKAKHNGAAGDYSHSPERNSYSDEWRMLP